MFNVQKFFKASTTLSSKDTLEGREICSLHSKPSFIPVAFGPFRNPNFFIRKFASFCNVTESQCLIREKSHCMGELTTVPGPTTAAPGRISPTDWAVPRRCSCLPGDLPERGSNQYCPTPARPQPLSLVFWSPEKRVNVLLLNVEAEHTTEVHLHGGVKLYKVSAAFRKRLQAAWQSTHTHTHTHNIKCTWPAHGRPCAISTHSDLSLQLHENLLQAVHAGVLRWFQFLQKRFLRHLKNPVEMDKMLHHLPLQRRVRRPLNQGGSP